VTVPITLPCRTTTPSFLPSWMLGAQPCGQHKPM
jgi:hypothetical protein